MTTTKAEFLKSKCANFVAFIEHEFSGHPAFKQNMTVFKQVSDTAPGQFLAYVQKTIAPYELKLDQYIDAMGAQMGVNMAELRPEVREKQRRYLQMFIDISK